MTATIPSVPLILLVSTAAHATFINTIATLHLSVNHRQRPCRRSSRLEPDYVRASQSLFSVLPIWRVDTFLGFHIRKILC